MPRLFASRFAAILLVAISFLALSSCQYMDPLEKVKATAYDGPEQAAQHEIEMTRDPQTGVVPWHKLLEAKQAAEVSKAFARQNRLTALSWEERGPNADAVGPSNGNTRANGGITAGRIRSIMVDSLDPNKKTVFVGSVSGGLWKTTDITASPAVWTPINDFMSNLAIAAITQDPRQGFQNIMYLCTGESFFNADAVQGVGVFKSIDGGNTWSFLSSTASYTFGTKILCDYEGNVYLATRNGLFRSTNGGSSWTNITPSGLSTSRISDIEISSTSAAGRLHMVTGISSTQVYRYTDIPSSVTSSTGWNAATTPFPSYTSRAEIAVSGSTLYAIPSNNSGQVPTVYKSTDGGDNWAAAGTPPNTVSGSPFANTQGWYDLSVRINPANPNECIIGGIDLARTLNGGTTWTRISAWVGTGGQYAHADQHDIQWWDGGNKLAFACDGGIHFSTDKGTTIRDRNTGLRVKQFYSVAIHPDAQSNYLLAGAQDNGVHKLSTAGLGNSVEVTGGDGAYVAIDQNEPNYQFGSYVYNVYRRSTNGGANWSSFTINNSSGRFINPWDYDNEANKIYACNAAGNYLRWDNPQTAPNAAGATTEVVSVAEFSGQNVSAVYVSPFTANRVFFGTGNGRVIRVDNANTSTPTAVNITPSGSTGYVNCVITGSTENNLMVVSSSYNVMNIWVSNDGGTTWTGSDGNLPNMPVRWAVFHPDSDTKAFIATEAGVWETDLLNGSSTNWVANPSFPNVKVSMLKYRASDRTIAAGSHGRGVWTASVPSPSGFSFSTPTAITAACPAPQNMSTLLNVISNGGFVNPVTLSATGNPAGTSVSFTTNPVAPGSNTIVVLNGTNTLAPGTYNITVTGTASGAIPQTRVISFVISGGTPPSFTTQPSSQTVCAGATANFVAVANDGTYQWQLSTDGGASYTNISGATSSTYSITNTTISLSGNLYRCVVTNICNSTSTSDVATLTVASGTSIVSSPSSVSLCVGASNVFRVTASGAGLSYQWQKSTDGGNTFTAISGANTAQYTLSGVTLAMNGDRYRCVVTGTCTPTTATSNTAVVTVVSALSITQQPVAQTVCAGTDASFTITAQGVSSYQWELSTNGGSTWSAISGAASTTYVITAPGTALSGNQYRCVVSGSCGTANSNPALLTVNPIAAITQQPVAQTICAGSDVSYSVVASGNNLTYQWQQSMNGCNGPWTNISGATTATYTISNAGVSLDNTAYRCVVNGSCTAALTSGCGLLNVVAPVTVVTQPASQTICDGSSVSFTTAGTGTGVIYQWQVNTGAGFVNLSNGGIYSGVTSAVLSISSASASMSTYQYRCLLSNAVCTIPATTNAAVLTVNTLPAIGSQPQSQIICANGTVLYTVSATGTGVQYQWQVNTGSGFVNISNGGNYAGATSSTLTVSSAAVSMSGNQYRCVVSGTCSPAVNSTEASLTVHAPVVITSAPSNVEICAGTDASFSISATSVPAINFQWQVSTDGGTNWTSIAGATAATYSTTGVPIVMNGNRYRCLVSSNTCSTPIASASATLTVRVVPGIGLTASPLSSLLPGQTTTLTASSVASTGGVVTTTWYYGTGSNLQAMTPNPGTFLVADVRGLGTYQVGIRETWPSGLFCSALSPTVTIAANVSSKLYIFPSPNDGNFSVSYYYSGSSATKRQLAIFDSKGARVYQREFAVAGPYTILPVDLRNQARGIYYVVVGDAAGNKLIEGKVHVR
ncbi:MAG: hypothetical protein ACO3AY_01480 [Chitinophagaceae bacterium]